MKMPRHFIPSPELRAMATETVFHFQGQPIRVYHHDGELVGMNMGDVCKVLGMTVEEAIDYLNEEPEAVQ